jgi:hypothetical protein
VVVVTIWTDVYAVMKEVPTIQLAFLSLVYFQ